MNYLGDTGVGELTKLTRKLVDTLRNYSSICFCTHRDADPDAVASVLGAKFMTESLISNVRAGVIFPEGVNRVATKILKSLGFEKDLTTATSCDLIVYVDASSKSQVFVPGVESGRDYVVIDHHETNELAENALLSIHLKGMASASEIIALMLEILSLRPDTRLATLLITGILYDTKNLRLAKPSTFRALYYLTKSCSECFNEALSLMTSTEVDRSEKIAVLKGISRTGLYELNKDFILALTCVGAHEASVLKTLIASGADVAIAISLRSGETRVYVRASQKIIEVLKSPIASDLVTYMARELGGSGGGHEGAAGLLLNYEANVNELLRLVKQFFARQGMKVSVLEEGRWVDKCSS